MSIKEVRFLHCSHWSENNDSTLSSLSRQAILNTINASLDRLETTCIDLLQIHQFDDETPVEETVEALHNLVKAGKVRYTGASSMWATQLPQLQFCAEKHGWAKFVSMQNYYNTLYREEEREMNRFCNETGVGIVLVCFGTLIGWLNADKVFVVGSTSAGIRLPSSGDEWNDDEGH
jgi:aryl-alcohol dehydrogenase-like predicted oxidoreductase